MSIKIMNEVWTHSKSTGRCRLVLLAIADQQGENGAWPSIATLALRANSSERSIKRDLAELEQLGELIVERQGGEGLTQYKTNRYWVNLPGVTDLATGVTESVSGVTELAPGVTTSGPQTLSKTLSKTLKAEEKKKGPHKLPDDFKPSAESVAVMAEHFPWLDIKLETHKFRDYWNSTPKASMKKDWDATWRNWMRNASKYHKPAETTKVEKHKFGGTK